MRARSSVFYLYVPSPSLAHTQKTSCLYTNGDFEQEGHITGCVMRTMMLIWQRGHICHYILFYCFLVGPFAAFIELITIIRRSASTNKKHIRFHFWRELNHDNNPLWMGFDWSRGAFRSSLTNILRSEGTFVARYCLRTFRVQSHCSDFSSGEFTRDMTCPIP